MTNETMKHHQGEAEVALPSYWGCEAFLRAVEGASGGRWGTWSSHVNAALMAGARPEAAGASDLAERCFDTLQDHLREVLQEEGLLPEGGPQRRFTELDLEPAQRRRVVEEARSRTIRAYTARATAPRAA